MKSIDDSSEATENPKFAWVGLVRLIAAVAGSLIASFFLVGYTQASHLRFQFEHPDGHLTTINEALIAMGWWVFAFPVVAFSFGIVLMMLCPKGIVRLESLVSIVWVVSLLLIVFPILTWQLQNVPMVNLRGAHF